MVRQHRNSSELRLRNTKTKNNPDLKQTNVDETKSTKIQTTHHPKKTKKKKVEKTMSTMMIVGFLVFYIPLLIVLNPRTLPQWIVLLKQQNSDVQERLVFVRIPKTGSTSFLEVLQPYTIQIDVGELEDVVTSLPFKDISSQRIKTSSIQGYHHPTLRRQRYYEYYKSASKHILYHPIHSKLTVLEGHMKYFDFERLSTTLHPNTTTTSILPSWLRMLYNIQYPSSPIAPVPQITLLRQPMERLASMYYYDRTMARTEAWRKDLLVQRGNVSFLECLANDTCHGEQNDFSRWCNLQTEILCGTEDTICLRGDSQEALERAKQNVENSFLVVGILERWNDTWNVLQHQLVSTTKTRIPSSPTWPYRKHQPHRPKLPMDGPVREQLNDLCQWDMELYQWANERLTRQLQEFGILS